MTILSALRMITTKNRFRRSLSGFMTRGISIKELMKGCTVPPVSRFGRNPS